MLKELLILHVLCGLPIDSCFSSGADSSQKAALVRNEIREGVPVVDHQKAKKYLESYGYMQPQQTLSGEKSSIAEQQLKDAILKFQWFAGLNESGELDAPTREKMARKRCGRKDVFEPTNLYGRSQIWEKATITWNVSTFPAHLSKSDTRKAIGQMLEVWRRELPIGFIEIEDRDKADIAIIFVEPSNRWPRDITGTAIAFATDPLLSVISLDYGEKWFYNEENDISDAVDIKRVLLHEIGHTLGLEHNPSPHSIMHPFFTPHNPLRLDELEKLPILPMIDVRNIHRLYGNPMVVSNRSGSVDLIEVQNIVSTECPREIEAAMENSEITFMFDKGMVWRLKNREVLENSTRIQQIFPDGPPYVNASATVGHLTILISGRTLFGYELEEGTGEFALADEWPKQLHGRVLFFPEAALPLSNGSIVIFSGDVFATYDIVLNQPTMINDKTVFFPNMPNGLVSGIPVWPDSDDEYRLFTNDTVYEYDNRIHEITAAQPLHSYVIC